MKQPRRGFNLTPGKLIIDCAQAFEWMMSLKDAETRTFSNGQKYSVFYHRFLCLILSEEDKQSLLFQLRGQVDAMNAESDAFLDKAAKAWEKQKKDYKEKTGKDIPILRLDDVLDPNKN